MAVALIADDPYAKLTMIASFISAGAAVLSVGLAGLAGFVAYRLFKVESERDARAEDYQRRRDDEMRRQQAAAVGFWTDETTGELFVSNNSQLPIYLLDVIADYGEEEPCAWSVTVDRKSHASVLQAGAIGSVVQAMWNPDGVWTIARSKFDTIGPDAPPCHQPALH